VSDPKVQCGNCPWRVGSDTATIPGYDRAKHRALRDTIATPGDTRGLLGGLRAMACHKSAEGAERVCVGWAAQQLGEGNNIALRLAALHDPRLQGLQTVGPQHPTLAATLRRRSR
jgi:hypothetical protein